MTSLLRALSGAVLLAWLTIIAATPALAQSRYDGLWSVLIITEKGHLRSRLSLSAADRARQGQSCRSRQLVLHHPWKCRIRRRHPRQRQPRPAERQRHWPAVAFGGRRPLANHFGAVFRDLDRRAPRLKSNKKLELRGMAGATGLEPAASGVTGRRSNQLSYAPEGIVRT